jgi:hypothetical protein
MKFKAIFAAIAVAAVALLATSCNKTDTGNNDAEINRVKKAAVGTWTGQMSELLGGKTIEVTFTESKVSTTGNFSANITAWKWSGTKVYVTLDDTMKSNMYVEVSGNTMKLSGDSTTILGNFPSTLTKK